MTQINVGGQLLNLSTPIIMGILNVTPDSFYDGGNYTHISQAIGQVKLMIDDGVQIIDIGGFSSRPQAQLISLEEEASRILPVIKEIKAQFPNVILSVDTYRSPIIDQVAKITDFIVNDITAHSQDSSLLDAVAYNGLPYILMHMQGLPENMQEKPVYENVLNELLDFFANHIYNLRNKGINQVIIDPGFGFGKALSHNYKILKNLNLFNMYDLPILVGLSRKSMIYNALKSTAEEALNGTTALHMIALINGAKILRVHDVKEAKETVTLYQQLMA